MISEDKRWIMNDGIPGIVEWSSGTLSRQKGFLESPVWMATSCVTHSHLLNKCMLEPTMCPRIKCEQADQATVLGEGGETGT